MQDTTYRPERLEVWIAIDWDDTATVQSMRCLRRRYPFSVEFLVTDRQDNLSVGYYNRLAKLCSGEFVQVLNDDCLFVTPQWDRLALGVLREYQRQQPDGVVYGRVLDNAGHPFSCFPVLSREALDLVGWVFHPEFTGWGADIHLYDVYTRVARVVDVPYRLEHRSHHTGQRQRDSVNCRLSNISRYNYGSALGESMRISNLIRERLLALGLASPEANQLPPENLPS